jgi:hypothetical protein
MFNCPHSTLHVFDNYSFCPSLLVILSVDIKIKEGWKCGLKNEERYKNRDMLEIEKVALGCGMASKLRKGKV